jgi:hypothetical protein
MRLGQSGKLDHISQIKPKLDAHCTWHRLHYFKLQRFQARFNLEYQQMILN